MITRSFDPQVFRKATEDYRDIIPESTDFEGWLANHKNYMFVEGDDIGLATFEYPGFYNIHWFFKSRGRAALALARRMFAHLFETTDAQVMRGLTKADLKAARWASRQVGLKSHGVMTYPDGDYEVFILTKDEFYKGINNES